MNKASLLLSVLFCLPITFIAALGWFEVLQENYSFKELVLAAFIIFVLLIGWIWFLTYNFLNWLKSKQIKHSLRDYLLLFIALDSVIAAVYYGRITYGDNDLSNSFLSNYEVEILSPAPGATQENICILEIKNAIGEKVRPENDPTSGFLLIGDWVPKGDGCQYFSPGYESGSLKFYQHGIPGEALQILFRENRDSGKVLVRVNGERLVEVNLNSEQDGSKLVSAPLQPGHMQIFIWNMMSATGWTDTLVMLLMIGTLLLKNIHIPTQVRAFSDILFNLLEKHPWFSLVPIAIGMIIMFWPPGAYVSPDVGYYLSLAKNLYHGNGYVNPDLSPNIYRGPVFPLLISVSYFLFGEFFRSAVIMERIFWILTILISYILGRQLFNHRVGFLTSVFVLSSLAINGAFYFIWTDGPLTFMILMLQWMFWQAFSKQPGAGWYVLMGLVMGTTYLLKQTALFIVPLPFLMWIVFAEYRTRQTFKKLLVYCAVFSLFFFGWMGYVYLAGGSPKQVASDLNIGVSIVSRFASLPNFKQISPPQAATPHSYSISLSQIFATYYSRDIASFFRIAPIIVLALGFTFFQAVVKKSKPDIHVCLGLFLFSILIPIQVVANFGFRQNLYFFAIGMICIAAMLERLFNRILSNVVSDFVVLTVTASLVFIQTSGGNYAIRQPIPVTDPETLNYYSDYQTLAAWVNKHVKPNEKILIDERDGDILHILTTGNRTFEIINNCRGQTAFWPAVACTPPYISFWIYNGTTDPDNPRDILNGISEPSLLSTLREKNIKYIFVTPRIYSLYYYVKIHPDFEEVAILGKFAIFRINRAVQPLSNYPNSRWETCVGVGTPEYLKNLKKSNPARYEAKLRDEIGPWMGLSEQDLESFQNWDGCQFGALFPGEYRLP